MVGCFLGGWREAREEELERRCHCEEQAALLAKPRKGPVICAA